jgi:hypothetical protein
VDRAGAVFAPWQALALQGHRGRAGAAPAAASADLDGGGNAGGIAYVSSQNYGLLLDQLATMDQVEERVRLYVNGLAAKGFPRMRAVWA